MVGVYRLPRRPNWLAPQRHAGFARRAVGLSLVASDASEHAVRPARHATLRPRHNVVNRASFHNSTSARATVATFTGCQLRFKTSVGRSSTFAFIVLTNS